MISWHFFVNKIDQQWEIYDWIIHWCFAIIYSFTFFLFIHSLFFLIYSFTFFLIINVFIHLIFVTSPAAIVVPATLNIIRPSCLTSLYNSKQIGWFVFISMIALEFLGRHLGFFFATSPVLLCNCEINFVMTAGWTRDCTCRTTGSPFVMGIATPKMTTWTWKHVVMGIGFDGGQMTSPTATICWSIPVRVRETWSPANALIVDSSSICIPEISEDIWLTRLNPGSSVS